MASDGVPAGATIAWAGKKRHAEGHLYCDEVLEHEAFRFASLLDLLPSRGTPAIRSIDEAVAPLTHARLRRFIVDEFDLAQFGVGRGDRVALLMPNGPALALAFVSVLSYCSCAPLNAASTIAEIRQDMAQSGVKLVIAMEPDPALVAAAAELGVVLVEATPSAEPMAGLFSLGLGGGDGGARREALASKEPSQRADESFVLFTSGSTGTKKLVPHLLEDLIGGAACIAAACQLNVDDVCCNQMPLYHIGGIARNVLAPILSGGSVVAMPFFEPSLFWKVAVASAATWYYAGPTMHALILETYKGLEPKPSICLRFVANAAGPLLHTVAEEMAATFGCSIMPSYGMTECMPVSSPPVGFALEKVGSSGQIVGPRCEIQNDEGEALPADTVGHIMVRGHPVMHGYHNNAEANAENFFNGWFRTGDMGKLDADGYLFITGRSKDVINRGGEIISPVEVEEAIQPHPWVQSCAAFHTPHDVLQETIGVLLVPQPGCPRIDLKTVHAFSAKSLHPSKWPQLVVYASNLPKTSTGKAMRTHLAKRLGLPSISDATPTMQLHYEAQMVPVGTPIKEPIPCALLQPDLDAIQAAMARPGRDVHVAFDEGGALCAYVTPRSASARLVAAELSHLDQYLVPEKIVPIGSIPRADDGSVNEASLAMMVEKMASRPAAGVVEGAGDPNSAASIEARIIDSIYRVTTVMAEAEDKLATTGIDSLNMIKLIAGLKQSFPDVAIPEMMLLNNPSIRELVEYIAERLCAEEGPRTARDATTFLQMDPVFGLRTILCLWIVRSHLQVYCGHQNVDLNYENPMKPIPLEYRALPGPRFPFSWDDLLYVDVTQDWRVSIFVLLASVTTSMKYDRHRVSGCAKVKEFLPPLLLMLWLGSLLELPLDIVGVNEIRVFSGGTTARYGFMVLSRLFTATLAFSFVPLISYNMGFAWYIGAQTLFLFLFNWMQDLSKGRFHCRMCCAGGAVPQCEHPKALRPFLKRLAINCLIPILLASVPTVVFYLRSNGTWYGIWHGTTWPRMPQFYLGVVLGQGMLHVEITQAEAKWIGVAADLVALFFIALIVTPWTLDTSGTWWPENGNMSTVILEMFHIPAMAFVIFAICRAPGTSYTARFLSNALLRELTPFTYCIYMIHVPIILWLQFVRRYDIQFWFTGTWSLQWYLGEMGFPPATLDVLLDQPLATLTTEQLTQLKCCEVEGLSNCSHVRDGQTVAQCLRVDCGSECDVSIESYFKVKRAPGIFGFDYTLHQFNATTLPGWEWGCGLDSFEGLELWFFCIAVGMVLTKVLHEPWQRWYSNHVLAKNKPKKRKGEWVYGTLGKAKAVVVSAMRRVTPSGREASAPRKTVVFSDSPKEDSVLGVAKKGARL